MKNKIIQKDGIDYTLVTLSNGENLEIRHPKGKDLKFAMSFKDGSSMGDIVFALASNLTCKSVEELEGMNIKDTSKIVNVVSGFLA